MSFDWSNRPIAEHYGALRGYGLISSFTSPGGLIDAIAVVVNFTEAKPTRRTDYVRSLVVCDPSAALNTTGLLVQFYRPSIEQLPRPAEGSIIVLKHFKLFDHCGGIQAWTNNTSKWIIYDPNGRTILSKSATSVPIPPEDVQVYIKRLAGWWKTRSGINASTEVALPPNLNSAGAHSTGRATISLKALREGQFCDVYGYVVKTYPSRENAFTVYLTDYTKNDQFHNYVYGESQWSGPFGQYTVQVTLWDAHARYAQEHVHEDQYILLRNLHGKRGDSNRLEGAVRGDRMNPKKVNVVIIPQTEPLIKPIKLRRGQYEATWKLEKERLDKEAIVQHQEDRAMQLTPPPSVNPNLSTSYEQVPITCIGDILEPPFVPDAARAEGAASRTAHKFRTIARIIDFWPPDLRDFSRPFCMTCSSTYEPTNPAINMDTDENHVEKCTICTAKKDSNDATHYEFSFTVLVEGQDSVCLPLIFSGDDVETLLGEDIVPCNLYLPENQVMLGRLREKLFLFWGGLEESFSAGPVKKKLKSGGKKVEAEEESSMWCEMCIKEYWVNRLAGEAGWNGRRFRGFGMTIL